MDEVQQRNEVEQSSEERLRFTKGLARQIRIGGSANGNLKRNIFDILHVGKRKVKFVVGTYHVYKNVPEHKAFKLRRLSYLTDQLRRYDREAVFVVVKEMTEDRFPHYHFIARLHVDAMGFYKPLPNLRNYKLWCREFDLGVEFHWQDENEIERNGMYITYTCHNWHVISANGIVSRNAAFKLKWLKYGIWRYILYITKYISSKSEKYVDYYF